ncbi:oligopeptidase A, partial [Candidatus Woesearchaeota archaeon]|nr:oligopeptidase A [Candidatus Woesearchaeota archaeon]
YYSYMWSKVYAQDMWSVFEEKGALNPEVGMQYRQKVLEPEGSIEPLTLVKNFLGREPNNKALLKDLGLEVIE